MKTDSQTNAQKQLTSRRRFLGQASCAAVTATPLLSTLLNLKMAGGAAAAEATDDYRALVCIFLAGGNDSFNMLVPTNGQAYTGYQAARSNLALSQSAILNLKGNVSGATFGVHPGMPEVQSLYDAGKLAFVSNVGTLVEPTTLARFQNNTAKVPLGLFSHSDQIMHWQTSVPNQRSLTGWGGRVADLVNSCNSNQRISMNISLSGSNTFQAGKETVSYEITSGGNGAVTLSPYGGGLLSSLSKTAVNSLMDLQYQNVFQKSFAKVNRRSIDASEEFASALGESEVATAFSDTELSQALLMIARTIGARQTLGMKRQTFFVLFGGWDHHEELLNNHARMLPVVSKAMAEFDNALTEIGMNNKVTTFTASDFARTLSSNGRGSDHGWGGNQMVMGGAVNGGTIYGTYPDLTPNNDLDTGRGRLIPTLSTDQYFAELAQWFGVPAGRLTEVFPNLSRFYSPSPRSAPIGFMS